MWYGGCSARVALSWMVLATHSNPAPSYTPVTYLGSQPRDGYKTLAQAVPPETTYQPGRESGVDKVLGAPRRARITPSLSPGWKHPASHHRVASHYGKQHIIDETLESQVIPASQSSVAEP